MVEEKQPVAPSTPLPALDNGEKETVDKADTNDAAKQEEVSYQHQEQVTLAATTKDEQKQAEEEQKEVPCDMPVTETVTEAAAESEPAGETDATKHEDATDSSASSPIQTGEKRSAECAEVTTTAEEAKEESPNKKSKPTSDGEATPTSASVEAATEGAPSAQAETAEAPCIDKQSQQGVTESTGAEPTQ